MKKILIIGGGVVGLCAARELAAQGYAVTVLEKDRCGSGASGAALGALVPYNAGRQDENPTAQRQSLWHYPAFAAELFHETGIDIQYRPVERLRILQSEQQRKKVEKWVEAAESWPNFAALISPSKTARAVSHPSAVTQVLPSPSTPQAILSPEQVQVLEPELEPAPFGALLCRSTATLNPAALMAALRASCLKRGVVLCENTPVHHLLYAGNKVTGVGSAQGVLTADKILLAAGAWTDTLLQNLPHSITELPEGGWNGEERPYPSYARPVKGQILQAKTKERYLSRLVQGRGVYLMPQTGPEGAGEGGEGGCIMPWDPATSSEGPLTGNQGQTLLIGATKEPNLGFDAAPTQEGKEWLLERAIALLPALATDCAVSKHWAGLRPASSTADGVPTVAPVPNVNNLLVATGHGGIGLCFAPSVGLLVAEMLQRSK